uniref:PP28 domain-containing protein n=1 Tax=Steinernema glaseri TaxID=37863 RepID=A0A1I7Z5T2_9BILA
MERKVLEASAPEEEGFLGKVKSVIGSLAGDGRGDESSDGRASLIDEEAMMPEEREMFERIQREKAQSELINSVHKHIIETGGDLDADKAVETLARKKNLENVDVRSLTIGGDSETRDEESKGEEGILDKVKSVAKSAFEVLKTETSQNESSEASDDRRSSSGVLDEESLTPEERANLEKIRKEKEHSELLNKVQKKKILKGHETFDPVKAQDDLRRQEEVKKTEQRASKVALREKSLEKKPKIAAKAQKRP